MASVGRKHSKAHEKCKQESVIYNYVMLLTWILIPTYIYLFNPPKNSPLSAGVVDSAMQSPESHQTFTSESVSSGSAAEKVWQTCMVDI